VSESLFGRDVEQVRVRQFVSDVRSGGSSLVLRGEAGAGKTALLDVAAGAATEAGFRVLRSTGVEFEADIAFSGLHEVLFPLSDSINAVNSRYKTAIRVALGLDEGPPPDQLLLSNAVLDVLVDAAEEYPVLLVVDDLQWVDRSSAVILSTVARRLVGMRVGFIAALRDDQAGFFDRTGLAELNVNPLDEGAARTLVDSRYPSLHPRARQRILSAASGNPLALIELPGALSAAGQALPAGASSVLPLTSRLRGMYASRISGFPRETREALLLAALEGTGDRDITRTCGCTI
jgi:predicted ATPase